jgi:hypothetical protein
MHPFGFFLLVPACILFLGTVWPFRLPPGKPAEFGQE